MKKQKLTKEQRKDLVLKKYKKVRALAWKKCLKVRELVWEKCLEECEKIDAEPDEIPDEIPEIIEQDGIRYKRIMESEK